MSYNRSDKPMGMLWADYLIKRTARKLELSETVVDKVVMSQFKQVTEAVKTYNEVEITGLGYFLFGQRMAERQLKELEATASKYKDIMEHPEKNPLGFNLPARLKPMEEMISKYRRKIDLRIQKTKADEDRLERFSRRVVQPTDSQQNSKGDS